MRSFTVSKSWTFDIFLSVDLLCLCFFAFYVHVSFFSFFSTTFCLSFCSISVFLILIYLHAFILFILCIIFFSFSILHTLWLSLCPSLCLYIVCLFVCAHVCECAIGQMRVTMSMYYLRSHLSSLAKFNP